MSKALGFTINIQGTNEAVETAEQLRRAIADIQRELKKASEPQYMKALEGDLVELKARQQELNAEVREQIKVRREELRAVDKSSGTYNQLSRQLNESRKRYKDLAAAEQESTQEAIALRNEITILDKRLKDIDASVGQFQRNVGGYSQAIAGFLPNVEQAFGQVHDGINAVNNSVGGLNKALGIFLIATTAFNAIAGAISQAIEASKEFNDIAARVANVQELTNQQLKDSVGTIVAISRTYQAESTDIVNAANTLSKELGTSYEESLTLIEAGFRKGANAQGDFLDQLREYPGVTRDAIGGAKNLVSVLILAQKEGIYSDKGIDAIKEFDLRIKEQTKASRAALEGAFGKKFTDDIFTNINNGSITTFEALKRVGKGLQDTRLTAQQTQTVIADVFGGPGEDAGIRYLQKLGDIDTELENIIESTNEYQIEQGKLFLANQRLAQAQSELAFALRSTSVAQQTLTTNVKAFLLEGVNATILALNNLGTAVKTGFAALGGPANAFNVTQKEAARLAREQAEAEKARAGDKEKFLKTEIGLQQRLNELRAKRAQLEVGSAEYKALTKEIQDIEKQLFGAAKATGSGVGKELGEKFIEGSIAAIQQRKGELEKAIARAVAGSDAQRTLVKELDKAEKDLAAAVAEQNRVRFEDQRKADAARLGSAEQIGTRLIQTQVSIGKKTIEAEKKTTQAVLNEVRQRNEGYQKLQEQQAKELEAFQRFQQEQLRDIIEGSAFTFFQSLNAFNNAANERRNAVFSEQITQTEQRLADLDARAQASTGIRRRALEKTIEQEKKLLEQQRANAEAAIKKQAKQEKAIALIQSIIQGALAVQRALASPPGPPFTIPVAIATGVFSAAQTAAIAAQPLARGGVVGISGRKVTDTQNMPTRSNGDNVLATVKRGEVVLNQRQQAALGGAATFKAIRVPGFTQGGPIGAPISAPRLPASGDAMAAITALDRKTDAINARLDRLRAYVVTDDITKDIADGESIRIKAEL